MAQPKNKISAFPDRIALRNYTHEIQRRLGKPFSFNAEQCSLNVGSWQLCRVIFNAQTIYKDYFCVPYHQEGLTAYIFIYPNGDCIFKEVTPKSTIQIVKEVFNFYIKGILLSIGIASPEQIKPLLEMYEKLPSILKIPISKMVEFVKDSIEFYQKSSARIKRTLHIDELVILHKISLTLSDEYRTYWTAQESKLAALSFKIFGDYQTVSSYVHLAELYFYIQIKNTTATEDEKRLETMKRGAQITKNINNKLKTYQRNPINLWSDIFYYSFQEGNKFIDEKGVFAGADVIAQLNEINTGLIDMKNHFNTLGLFEVALEQTNLITLDAGINDLSERLNTVYNENMKPTFKVIEGIYNKQQKAIAELERRWKERLKELERSYLISTDPDKLSDKDKIIQNNQFIKMFNNAISGIDNRYKFKTIDIEDL